MKLIKSSVRQKRFYHHEEELKEKPFNINLEDAISTFQRLVNCVVSIKKTLYILVDEYDSSINESLGNIELYKSKKILPKSS